MRIPMKVLSRGVEPGLRMIVSEVPLRACEHAAGAARWVQKLPQSSWCG